MLGARLDWIFRFGRHIAADAAIIQVDVDFPQCNLERRRALGVRADVGSFLDILSTETKAVPPEAARDRRDRAWLSELQEARQLAYSRRHAQSVGDGSAISPMCLARELHEALPRDAITIFDSNLVLAACQRMIPAYLPASRLTPGGSGGLGAGIPFALAAKIEHPERPVVAICGDFAFGVSAMELETAVRHNLPIVVVVANNDGNSGSLRQRMHLADRGAESVMMFRPGLRYERIMEMFGGRAEHVEPARGHRTRVGSRDCRRTGRMHQRGGRSRRALPGRLTAGALLT